MTEIRPDEHLTLEKLEMPEEDYRNFIAIAEAFGNLPRGKTQLTLQFDLRTLKPLQPFSLVVGGLGTDFDALVGIIKSLFDKSKEFKIGEKSDPETAVDQEYGFVRPYPGIIPIIPPLGRSFNFSLAPNGTIDQHGNPIPTIQLAKAGTTQALAVAR